MKREINILKLGWIIYKNKLKMYTFSNALKLAWRIFKARIKVVTNQNELFLICKNITNLKLLNTSKVSSNTISITINEYNLNILFYQLNRI